MPPPPVPASALGSSSTVPDGSTYTPPMSADELTALRARYLGVGTKKRKLRKMSDRKFVFDWDETDDTFAADAPGSVGAARQGAQVMFGRGHIAGMDDGGGVGAGSGDRRSGGRDETQLADAMERRKAAKAGYDDRHWTEKPLDDMKERDWRIFREDFSIAARGACGLSFVLVFVTSYLILIGGNIPHPLRSWEESIIPTQILEIVDKVGYKEPSPIQRQAIPIGLQNRDIIGIAETGTHS